MAPPAQLLGASPGIVAVREKVQQLLRQSAGHRLPPILIRGETGTGKGLLARMIHGAGPRRDGPFVDVNCAAIPETLLEAELFGFERGAFTDARRAKPGLFQTAHRGTIFLDEVGLLSETLQAKLLKVIEERVVRRLGSTQGEHVDVSILAATNENLVAAVRARRFREDLYHRLAVLTVELPPLRERREDILLLAEHFLARTCTEYGLAPKTLATDAKAALDRYQWPGNVRELANVIERASLFAEGPVLTAAMLLPGGGSEARMDRPVVARADVSVRSRVAGVEEQLILRTLAETNWNITHTATRMGLSRNTLKSRIKKYGLQQPGEVSSYPGEAQVVEPAPAPPSISAATPARPGVQWEFRRLVFLRVALTTPENEQYAAESSRALDMLIRKVEAFGGRLIEIGATGIIVAFGLEPMEDAPRRAALAAMAMHKAVLRDGGSEVERPAMRTAIHAVRVPIVRVGVTAEIDADAKRPVWSVLDGLIVAAGPGAIVLSQPAMSLLARRFEVAATGATEAASGPAYNLTAYRPTPFDLGGHMGRFVGREHELELLRSRLEATRQGQGQVVALSGEAGIGKSRLLFEFSQGLTGHPATYLEGHCLSYGSVIPYLPILEILRAICRLAEFDPPEIMADKIRIVLEGVGIDPTQAAPYLLHLLGIKNGTDRVETLSPGVIKARTFETLHGLFLRSSHREPLIMAIEDLHWVDQASEEYLADLVERVVGARILMVATYRPGYRPPWIEKSSATQVALQPLASHDSLTVVRVVFGTDDVAEPLARIILAKAEGNPLFLEELARAAREQGPVSTALTVPDTVQEVLLARIDRLPAETKRLLQTAAVIGPEFSLPLLRAVCEGPGLPDAHLRELTRLEFLYERSETEGPTYVFRHALTQEAVYGSLLERHRRTSHAAVGHALEVLYAERTDEIAELLAHHFGRSDEPDKAVDYAILAAEKAQRRWANSEALTYFDDALHRLDAMPDTRPNRLRRIDAVIKQAEVKFALGKHTEHIQALEKIRSIVDEADDPRRRAAWYYWTGFLYSLTGGRPELTIEYCREAAAIASAGGFDEIDAFATSCLAQVYIVAGNPRAALEAGQRALSIFETRGNLWWAGRTLWVLSSAANALGEWDESLTYCRRALEYGIALKDLRLTAVGWWRTGSAHIQQGDPERGLQCCDEALALSPIPYDAAMAKAVRGYGLIKAGRIEAGITDLSEAVAWFDVSHLRYVRSLYALWLAEGHLRGGDRAGARALIDEVLNTSRTTGYLYFEGLACWLMGDCLAAEAPTAAEDYVDTAVRIFERIGARNDLAKAMATRAALRQGAGDITAARELLEQAKVIFETLGTRDEPARVKAALVALDRRV